MHERVILPWISRLSRKNSQKVTWTPIDGYLCSPGTCTFWNTSSVVYHGLSDLKIHQTQPRVTLGDAERVILPWISRLSRKICTKGNMDPHRRVSLFYIVHALFGTRVRWFIMVSAIWKFTRLNLGYSRWCRRVILPWISRLSRKISQKVTWTPIDGYLCFPLYMLFSEHEFGGLSWSQRSENSPDST